MGILNVTPDSFSDGGRFNRVEAAVAHGLALADQGAAILDVGGESTRPGAQRVDAGEQVRRTRPVIEALSKQNGDGPRFTMSIDTTLSAVALAALDAGATIVNDVSAGREDPRMFELVSERKASIILMHMLGEPGTMQDAPRYGDVVAEVEAFLHERVDAALNAGIAKDRIAIDPGIGFGKTLEHNLALLGALPRFVAMGVPVVLGASRKRFIAQLTPHAAGKGGLDSTGPDSGGPDSGGGRLGGTIATTLLAADAGVAWVRVHDVAANAQALCVHEAVVRDW